MTLELTSNARDLIGFGPRFHDNTVSLRFLVKFDVATALTRTFGNAGGRTKGGSKSQRKVRFSRPEIISNDQINLAVISSVLWCCGGAVVRWCGGAVVLW